MDQHNVANWLRSAKESGELECLVTPRLPAHDHRRHERCGPAGSELVREARAHHDAAASLGAAPAADGRSTGRSTPRNLDLQGARARASNPRTWPTSGPSSTPTQSEEVARRGATHASGARAARTIDHLTALRNCVRARASSAHANPGEKRIPFWEPDARGHAVPEPVAVPMRSTLTAPFVQVRAHPVLPRRR